MKNAEIFLETIYNCKDKKSLQKKSYRYINCKHWSVDQNTCDTECSIKIYTNPSPTDCAKCTKREPYVGILVNSKPIKQKEEPSFVDKTVSYVKAESSQMISGKVSEKIFNKRKAICMDCSYRTNPKPESETIGWCKGGCGCVIGNPRAALSQKLYMPTVSCPQKKWAPDNGEGFKISDALDSLKGIKNSIQSLFKKDK